MGGKNVFELLDYVCSNVMMPLGGLSIALLAGWKAWPVFKAQINAVHQYPAALNTFLKFSLRFLAPLLVIVVVATGL